MKKTLILLLLLAGCGRGDQPPDERSAASDSSGPGASKRRPAAAAREESGARLTGLYEGGAGPQKNQLCIVEKGGDPQFGLLVWGGNLNSCSGAGRVERRGEKLTLAMAGDETCTIEATLKDGVVTLPGKLALGCAYYCAARASFAGASFTRSGEDVKKATDIAGDPLCE